MAKNNDKPKRKRITTKAVQATEKVPFVPALPPHATAPDTDEDSWDDDRLTFKQKAFILAYIGPAAGNGTRAAELAGYRSDNRDSLKATAWEVLTKPYVQAALAQKLAEKRANDPDWAIRSLADVASSSLANVLELTADGKLVPSLEKAAEAAALGQIKEYKADLLPGDGGPQVIRCTIKMHDRRPAIESLLKIQGRLADHVTVDGEVTHKHEVRSTVASLLSDPEAREHARQMRERLRGINNANEN